GETIYFVLGLAPDVLQEHHCVSSSLLCKIHIFGGGKMTVGIGGMHVEEIFAAPPVRSQSSLRRRRQPPPSNARIPKRARAAAARRPDRRAIPSPQTRSSWPR